MANDSIELGRIRAKVLRLEDKADNISYSDSTSSIGGSVNISGNLSFAPATETKILLNSKVNAGSDKAFILYKEESSYHVAGSSQENSRLSIGVYNDNESNYGEGLDLQGGASLIFNVGSWDNELTAAIGTQYAPVGSPPGYPIKFRINNSDVAAISSSGNFIFSNSVGIGTSIPTKPLHLSASTLDPVMIENSSDGNFNRILYKKPSRMWSIGQTAGNDLGIADETANVGHYRFFIDSNGRVGINGNSATTLTVNCTRSVNDGIIINNTNADYQSYLLLNATGSSVWQLGKQGAASSHQFFLWDQTGGRNVLIANRGTNGALSLQPLNGNVGIGTTSPSDKLQVSGPNDRIGLNVAGVTSTLNFGSTVSGEGTRAINFDRSTGLLKIQGGNVGSLADYVTITTAGNVGIGTTNPGANLHVKGNGNVARLEGTDHAYIEWYPDGPTTRKAYTGFPGSNANYFIITNEINTGDGHVVLQPGTDANVGVGTTNPNYKLDVNGSFKSTNAIIGNTSYDAGSIEINANGSGNRYAYIDFHGDDTWGDYGLRVIRGNTGANTISEVVHRGTGDFSMAAVEAANFKIRTTNTTRLTVASDGDVGIGTTSPAALLNINNSVASNTDAPDASSTNHQLLITNTKAGSTKYSMAIGMDQTLGIGYINAAGNSSVQPVCLQTRGGSVGIGTPSPNSAYKLDVSGEIRSTVGFRFPDGTIQTTAGGSGGSGTGTVNAGVTGRIAYYPANSNTVDDTAALYTDNTNVGIGSTSPNAKLEIRSPNSPTTLNISSEAGFGASRISMYSDRGSTNEWRPCYLESADNGSFTGRLNIYTNGTGIANKNGSVLAASFVDGGMVLSNGADLYEEGTWTPALRATSSVGLYVIGINVWYANYVKIGKKVIADFNISISSIGGGSATDEIFISNLPFAPATNSSGFAQCTYYNAAGYSVSTGVSGPPYGIINTSNSRLELYKPASISSSRLIRENLSSAYPFSCNLVFTIIYNTS